MHHFLILDRRSLTLFSLTPLIDISRIFPQYVINILKSKAAFDAPFAALVICFRAPLVRMLIV